MSELLEKINDLQLELENNDANEESLQILNSAIESGHRSTHRVECYCCQRFGCASQYYDSTASDED